MKVAQMPMLKNRVLPVGAGLGLGLAVAWIWGAASDKPQAVQESVAVSQSSAVIIRREDGRADERITALEARVRRIDNTATGANAALVASASAPPASTEHQELTPEDYRARTAKYRDDSIASFRNQPVDPAWAGATQKLLTADLESSSKEHKFSIVGVECRDTSCLATLEWPTLSDAAANYKALRNVLTKANCGQEMYVDDDPRHPDARTQARLVSDLLTRPMAARGKSHLSRAPTTPNV
jgi:hypothetical protein